MVTDTGLLSISLGVTINISSICDHGSFIYASVVLAFTTSPVDSVADQNKIILRGPIRDGTKIEKYGGLILSEGQIFVCLKLYVPVII